MKNYNRVCKVCGKTAKGGAKGFCKSHCNAFSRKNLDFDGNPKEGYYLDDRFHLKKKKNTLRILIIESYWYRTWRDKILKRDAKSCVDCGKKGLKLYVHHEKLRMADIINTAKSFYKKVEDQIKFCKRAHTSDIAITLCGKCHAKKHEGEKIHAILVESVNSDVCLICNTPTYCKNFCKFHYQRFKARIIDQDGIQLRIPRNERTREKCLVCENQTVGFENENGKFCQYHLSRFRNGIIDINGTVLRDAEIRNKDRKCKVCDRKHSSKGFCETHYNRYKIGQIDKDGMKLRELLSFETGTRKRKSVEFKGQSLSIIEWAKLIGIDRASLEKRLRKWTLEKALTTPPLQK